jgi:ABC-type antimicrobial peptide transport system permease subunit
LEREIELPVTNPRPMREVVSESIGRERLAMRLMGVFGVTALALAAFGLYGLIAYGVAQRAREIGIRLALGAARDGIRWLVIGRGLRLTLAGMAIGLSVAALFTRTISQALFDASLWEAPVLAGALIVVFGTSILATWVPGRRASRIDPAASLRLE